MQQLFGKPIRIISLLVPKMWLIEGNERITGKPLSVLWCGPIVQQAYMLTRIFGVKAPDRHYLGRRPVILLKHLLKRYGCSLGVVAGPDQLLTRLRQRDDIEVSWWIGSEVDIAAVLDPDDHPHSLKDDLRRVRKNGLEFRCATDAESYRRFYDNYYLPTIVASHGAAALPSDFDTRWSRIMKGEAELVWVMRGDEPICGMVVCYDDSVPILRDIGIKNGDKALRKTGAITAAYYFALQRIEARGFDRARLGLSRPFLNDGVLTFKEKFRPELTGTSQESFLIRINSLCDASRSFLSKSSFIGEAEGELRVTLIAANDDDYKARVPLLHRLSSIYGINACSYIDVSGRRPRIRKAS
ncbi:MAG: GNAT family N-acetyltransferase [Gammaproteobacteria bacterium]|nr:GNAT family N-acetyltransferase [Gammaproteobacteria bacterium]